MGELLDVTLTSPSDWHYVSEGGATIVYSYRGSYTPSFAGTVLRLRKIKICSDESTLSTIQGTENQINGDVTLESRNDPNQESSEGREYKAIKTSGDGDDGTIEPDDPSVEFQHRITSRLIPLAFLPRLESVRVKSPWLAELLSLSDSERPPERRREDTIDIRRHKAVLATDLVGGSGWTVEVKPKWGFLPNPAYLSQETLSMKSQYCRFCMHSQFRTGYQDPKQQNYCPLDLYSRKESRVAHALRCLWNAWIHSSGTANNLKIFVRGKVLDPNDASEVLAPLLSLPKGVDKETLSMAFAAALLPPLQETPVLGSLARLQRTLDPLDIEGLRALYNSVINTENANAHKNKEGVIHPLEKVFPQPTFDDWECFINIYLSNGHPKDMIPDGVLNIPVDSDTLHHYIMAYLLSATFKDCSIMIQPRGSNSIHDRVTVIDLDPKQMTRLKKWEALDREIATSFRDAGLTPCSDEYLESLKSAPGENLSS